MSVIRTRVFRRYCLSNDNAIDAAMNEIVADVNALIAGLPNIGDVADLRYDVRLIGMQPERIMCVCSVAYVTGA